MTEKYATFDFEDAEKIPSPKSGVPIVDLTEALGCNQLRARVWYLDPGDEVAYHRHDEQEELYVPLDGPGQLRIDGKLVDVPAGTAVRIPPETPRQPRNESDHQQVWLIVGAPPVEEDGIHLSDE